MRVCVCVYVCSLNGLMGCLAGRVNRTVLYDNGGLRFMLHGEGCKSGKNSSNVMIILLCRQGKDQGQPELFSQVGSNERRFCPTNFAGLASSVHSRFCTGNPHLTLPQTMLFCINANKFLWPWFRSMLPRLIKIVFTGSWWILSGHTLQSFN